jgi:hypothetical protein
MSGAFVNRIWHFEETLQCVERQCGLALPRGQAFWYDPLSGCAGLEGQGTSALLPPGLDLGGPLPADVSAGASGVFINGRQITQAEVLYLMGLTRGPILPGRYWLDGHGNAGQEGGPALVNLHRLAQAGGGRGGGGGSDWTWQGKGTGVSASGDGGRNVAVFWEGGMYSQDD